MRSDEHTLKKMQKMVLSHPTGMLYKNLWDGTLPNSLKDTPILTWETLIKCPFKKRIYTDESLIVHIVYRDSDACLIGRTATDMHYELYGSNTSTRPLVALYYRHHAIEKSFWFYERNILPLIALDTSDATLSIARMYDIDAMVLDERSVAEYLPHSKTFPKLKHVHVIGIHFDAQKLLAHVSQNMLTLVLALPETGTIALSCPEALKENKVFFHPAKNSLLEHGDSLIVTRTIILPTPIIRYDTEIKTTLEKNTCSCKNVSEIFSLL